MPAAIPRLALLEPLSPSTPPPASKRLKRSDKLPFARSVKPMRRQRRSADWPSRLLPRKKKPLLRRRRRLPLPLPLPLQQPPKRAKPRSPRTTRPSLLRASLGRCITEHRPSKKAVLEAGNLGSPRRQSSQGALNLETGDLRPTSSAAPVETLAVPEADVAAHPEDIATKVVEVDPVPMEHQANKLLPRGQATAKVLPWMRMDGRLCQTKRDVRDVRRNKEETAPQKQ
jgi:hypothetical protein